MAKEECGNCRFYEDNGGYIDGTSGFGWCQRFPEHKRTDDGRWCGEYTTEPHTATDSAKSPQ